MKSNQILFNILTTTVFATAGFQGSLAADTQQDASKNPSMLIQDEDGSSVQIDPDGTKIIKKRDGTIVQVKTDGTKLIKEADGSSIQIKADGTKIINKPDGTSVEIKPSPQH